MLEGRDKGAEVAMQLAYSFDFSQDKFQQILYNYVGLEGAISIPHTHYCGSVTRVLTQGTDNHLQICPVLGRNSALHNAIRDVLLWTQIY